MQAASYPSSMHLKGVSLFQTSSIHTRVAVSLLDEAFVDILARNLAVPQCLDFSWRVSVYLVTVNKQHDVTSFFLQLMRSEFMDALGVVGVNSF